MATRATAATPAIPLEGMRAARRVGERVGTWGLTSPRSCCSLVFFLLPIYFIVRFSLGLDVLRSDRGRRRDRRRADELLDAALVAISSARASTSRCSGRRRCTCRPGSPASCSSLLVAGAVAGKQISERYGGWIVGRLVRAADRAVPDHPGGQQPAARRRAVRRAATSCGCSSGRSRWRRRRRSGR